MAVVIVVRVGVIKEGKKWCRVLEAKAGPFYRLEVFDDVCDS